jgi:hypothetical protein
MAPSSSPSADDVTTSNTVAVSAQRNAHASGLMPAPASWNQAPASKGFLLPRALVLVLVVVVVVVLVLVLLVLQKPGWSLLPPPWLLPWHLPWPSPSSFSPAAVFAGLQCTSCAAQTTRPRINPGAASIGKRGSKLLAQWAPHRLGSSLTAPVAAWRYTMPPLS